MGDMADYLIEQGQQQEWEHAAGQCEGPCNLCEEEERQREKWREQKRRQRKAKKRKEKLQ